MSTNAVRVAAPILGILFNTGLTVSGYVNLTVAIICWALMAPVVLGALFWPRIRPLAEKAKRVFLRRPVYIAPTEAEFASKTDQPSNEDLRQRCCELSAEIFEFYQQQRQNMEDSLQSEYWDTISDASLREQKRADEIAGHDRWIVDEYRRKFGSKILALSTDLAQVRAITPEDRNIFKNPTRPQDVQYIAARLDEICTRFDSALPE